MTAPPPKIFNRRLYARRRARAAAAFPAHDFLHQRAMKDVVDRLETVTRDFPLALFHGAGDLLCMLTPEAGVGAVINADLAARRLGGAGPHLVFDDEQCPLAAESFDLIVSLLMLHAANDLVGALVQMRRALKPDGLFIAVLFGEDTLREVRQAFYEAETELAGGVSPRVAPFAAVRDLGGALQRAGFALPVADLDRVEVAYRDAARLFADLRGMGETSCLADRGRALRRDTLALATAKLAATPTIEFDLVTLTGWAPHESQQKPLKPGSAEYSLARAVTGRTP
jgi:SAM-dependent methyltransferase